uniref:Uncharacterized protein n=1 Tax=Rhizophora mucronata TaxID=61149 RepID=A0A2P2P0R6_RHIMU
MNSPHFLQTLRYCQMGFHARLLNRAADQAEVGFLQSACCCSSLAILGCCNYLAPLVFLHSDCCYQAAELLISTKD